MSASPSIDLNPAPTNLITDFSEDVRRHFIATWLTLEDVCRLDTAYCNKQQRPILLATLRSEQLVMGGEITVSDSRLRLLNARGISAIDVHFDESCSSASIDASPELTAWLDITGDTLTKIEARCPNAHMMIKFDPSRDALFFFLCWPRLHGAPICCRCSYTEI
jgi:hypothetical protein